jgi:hypothetical protein
MVGPVNGENGEIVEGFTSQQLLRSAMDLPRPILQAIADNADQLQGDVLGIPAGMMQQFAPALFLLPPAAEVQQSITAQDVGAIVQKLKGAGLPLSDDELQSIAENAVEQSKLADAESKAFQDASATVGGKQLTTALTTTLLITAATELSPDNIQGLAPIISAQLGENGPLAEALIAHAATLELGQFKELMAEVLKANGPDGIDVTALLQTDSAQFLLSDFIDSAEPGELQKLLPSLKPLLAGGFGAENTQTGVLIDQLLVFGQGLSDEELKPALKELLAAAGAKDETTRNGHLLSPEVLHVLNLWVDAGDMPEAEREAQKLARLQLVEGVLREQDPQKAQMLDTGQWMLGLVAQFVPSLAPMIESFMISQAGVQSDEEEKKELMRELLLAGDEQVVAPLETPRVAAPVQEAAIIQPKGDNSTAFHPFDDHLDQKAGESAGLSQWKLEGQMAAAVAASVSFLNNSPLMGGLFATMATIDFSQLSLLSPLGGVGTPDKGLAAGAQI